MSLKEELNKILETINIAGDKFGDVMLIDLIYKRHKDKTLELFLKIQERERLELEKENLDHYRATEQSMHMVSQLASELLENKTSRGAKLTAEEFFKGDNIAHTIDVMKVYFPNKSCDRASNNGKWFFNAFVETLQVYERKYIKGGDSRWWVEKFGHAEYIDELLKIKEKDHED